MDVNKLSISELRRRIAKCKARISILKEERKKYYVHIRSAKNLIKNIERNIDLKRSCPDIDNLEATSVRSYLKYLQESLISLDNFWLEKVNECTSLHKRVDDLNEQVYP